MIVSRRNGIVREWRINQVGWPWHGLVTGALLEYKSGSTKTYPAQSYPMWHKFQGRRRAAPTRDSTQQTADASAGRQWLDYAVIAGHEGVVCGQKLGPGRWIYSDPNGNNWLLHAKVELNKPTTGHAQLSVILEALFGRFDGTTYPELNKELATLDLGEVYTAYTDIDTDAAKYWFLEPNLTGSAGYLNITETCYPTSLYDDGYTGCHPAFYVSQAVTDDDSGAEPHSGMRALKYVVSFSVTGKGVIHPRADLCGRNVACSLTLSKDIDDIYQYNRDNTDITLPTGYCLSGGEECACSFSHTSNGSETITRSYLLRVYADGTELKATQLFEETSTASWTISGKNGTNCLWSRSQEGGSTETAAILLGAVTLDSSVETYEWSGSDSGEGYLSSWAQIVATTSTTRVLNGTTVNYPNAEIGIGMAVIFQGNRTLWLDVINDPPISASATNDAHTLYKVGINVANEAVVAAWVTGDYYETDNAWGYCPTTIDNIAFDPVEEVFARAAYTSAVYWT